VYINLETYIIALRVEGESKSPSESHAAFPDEETFKIGLGESQQPSASLKVAVALERMVSRG
jgi:hypothetical protein